MNPFRLWVYLQTTPLFWLTATLAAFLVADALARARAGARSSIRLRSPSRCLGGCLKLTGADYQTYFNGAQFVHFLLGPATVALGVPIYTNLALVKRNVWPLAAALFVGGDRGDRVGGAGRQGARRAAPGPHRARAEVDHRGRCDGGHRGARRRAAADRRPRHRHGRLRRDHRDPAHGRARRDRYAARGFAVGLTSHGIGTARAFAVDPVAGVFAGVAMGLNAVVTPALIPALLPWLIG